MRLRPEVLGQAFEHLRRCGTGLRECVVYLTGPLQEPSLIDGVIHPRHSAGPAGYDLDSAAIAELWIELARDRRSVRAQVHTHPGPAFHSARDDRLALVHTPGFLSLVIPNFALGRVGLDGACLVERNEDGDWVRVTADDRLQIERPDVA
jgi:hypothetical protein